MIALDQKEEKKTLSLGFIGIGWIGRNRMEVLLNGGQVKADVISEPFEQNAIEALKLAPHAQVIDNPVDAYANPELDGVVIATPSALHASQSLNALSSGKAVFCQKPLGRTANEVRQVVKASQKSDKLLAVDLSYRYTRAFQAVKETIQNGEIGRVYAVNLVFHNAYGPDKDWFYDMSLSGGGCVMDLGIHLVDMALCCLEFPEIEAIRSHLFSKGVKLVPGEERVEDYAKVSMLTEQNTAINLDCSWHVSAGRDAEIEATFFGTDGGVSFKNVNGSFYDFKAEKYHGTQTEELVSPPDDWSGRAGLVWAKNLLKGVGYDAISATELVKTAEVIDRIYGRQS
ncbi:Gfo/Idh/MocA family oxidoreductase [Marivirga sp. S37H4]|uniref:Gfo/Idh/MocA family oxidoreductase n=1 Tax=Marivirga aurantiaca TaxID=2802615 RepID=A0A934WXZ9_9BACT|nr:Gfo/Idh/MocA family oxidoreductase [Marivirga aurantiaca]MBK6264977.1 Gfo/Idh/MocA family oxidoreductase [Marivirga aurantiaca]